MANQLNNVSIFVNNAQISYTAGTLTSRDGFAEYQVRNAVLGGGQSEQVFSEVLESKFGMVKWSVPTTPENKKLTREWKANRNNNVVELVGPEGSNFTRVFSQASILNDPEADYSTDGNIEVEFNSNPAI